LKNEIAIDKSYFATYLATVSDKEDDTFYQNEKSLTFSKN